MATALLGSTIETIVAPHERAEEVLRRAAHVVEGLSPDDVAETQRIALDRSGWRRQ